MAAEHNPDYSIIRWRPIVQPPDSGNYILLTRLNETGEITCEYAAYECGIFLYIYDQNTWGEINKNIILGWSYLPFDGR